MTKNINDYNTKLSVFTFEEILIYNLLFEKYNIINIKLDDFCKYTSREKFKEKIRNIAKRGCVRIIDDRMLHDCEYIVWKIEVRR